MLREIAAIVLSYSRVFCLFYKHKLSPLFGLRLSKIWWLLLPSNGKINFFYLATFRELWFLKWNFLNTMLYVYFSIKVQRIGCFKDTSRRAIPQLDGKSRLLRGNYQRRINAIEKCAAEAVKQGYNIIGLQNGGWCASGPRAHRTFAKYGRSSKCKNGKGGPWANDVYRIVGN